MRSETSKQSELFSHSSLESRIPADHPRKAVDKVLTEMNSAFDYMHSITAPSTRRSGSFARCCCRFYLRFALNASQ
jgi:hypothetical protein